MNAPTGALLLVAGYLGQGLAFVILSWRFISDDADRMGSRSQHYYWWAVTYLVVLWPKMLWDLRRR